MKLYYIYALNVGVICTFINKAIKYVFAIIYNNYFLWLKQILKSSVCLGSGATKS